MLNDLDWLYPKGTGDNYTTAEKRLLGKYKYDGKMPYGDLDGYYCLGCSQVINVKCANCGAWSENRLHIAVNVLDRVFTVQRPFVPTKENGLYWTTCECRKCDFRFKVIVR